MDMPESLLEAEWDDYKCVLSAKVKGDKVIKN
jgi:hypothetical protein